MTPLGFRVTSVIEIREPRGGDENVLSSAFLIMQRKNIEIREPRGGDENRIPDLFNLIFLN